MTQQDSSDQLVREASRLSPLTPVVRSFLVLVAAGWTVFRDLSQGRIGYLALGLGGLLVAGGIFGFVSWWRTRFWIEADELRVDTGAVFRQSRRIRIDRLQGIDIVQPFVARFFGLAELRMDVAGGSAREGSLAYLQVGEAQRLKDLLLTRRDQVRAAPAPGAAPTPAPDGAAAPSAPSAPSARSAPDGAAVFGAAEVPPAPDRLLARVSFGTLLASLLLSTETVVLVVAGLALLASVVVTVPWLGAAPLLPIVLGTGLSVGRKLTAYHRFTLTETPAGVQVRRGMFDLTSQTITLARVQGVVITEPLLWRLLGWAKLDVSIAGYGSGTQEGPTPSTVLPVGDRALVGRLATYLIGNVEPDAVPLRPVPREARWLSPIARFYEATGATDRLVVSREGWLSRRTHVAPQARVQSLRVTQGPVQRLLGLADVQADSPPGPTRVHARNRTATEARSLFEHEIEMTASARART